MNGSKDAMTIWEGQVEEFKVSPCPILTKNFWESMENQLNSRNILPGFSTLQILQEIQHDLRRRNIEPGKFTDPIIFMSMFNDIDWTRKGSHGICISNLEKVKEYAKRFLQGHWTFLGPGEEKKWYGTLLYTTEGTWDTATNLMVERFKDTGQEYQCF